MALLPGVVAAAVPALLVAAGGVEPGWGLAPPLAGVVAVLGAGLVAAGAALVAWTVVLFVRVGRGTLAPWDPTERLVVAGPYRHVRNPMITGVAAVLAGEAALLGSRALLLWLASFAVVNALYLPLVEEPGLRRRFGPAYDRYRANVPRWLPRLRAWGPGAGPGVT